MARFSAANADNYGGTGGTGYFSLKNDKDVARVRFMYNGIDDVEGFAVHEVHINDKKRYVNCLRDYNEPKDKCPFCANNMFVTAKFFIPLYNIESERTQVWERGKKFVSKISSICSRYPNLVSHTFEIERNGQAGSTQTTYEIYEVDKDDTTLEDLPEMPEILGSVVLDKTADEMEYYLDNGDFPENDNNSRPERRTSRNEDREDRPTGRRTPANTGSRRGDRF
jgi:hypothetical protein